MSNPQEEIDTPVPDGHVDDANWPGLDPETVAEVAKEIKEELGR